MSLNFSYYDWLLIAVVSVQGTLLAYIHHPRLKAFMLNLPFPFTVACLAVNRPVGIQNITAFILLFVYTYLVYYLHKKLRIWIVAAIVAAAAVYCVAASLLAPVLPQGSLWFWVAVMVVFTGAVAALFFMPSKPEQGQRSRMPAPLKLIIIISVVILLIIMKKWMEGFITLFPMVGVVASYECRKSLWTNVRQIPILTLLLLPLQLTCYLVEPYWGLGRGLLAGWVVFLIIVVPYFILLKKRTSLPVAVRT